MRLLFGLIWAIDAYVKWLPGYRSSYVSNLKSTAQGQPSWLHGWFHFWINLQTGAPTFFADLTGVMETALALVLILGVARRVGYTIGAVYALLVWAVGEGFGARHRRAASAGGWTGSCNDGGRGGASSPRCTPSTVCLAPRSSSRSWSARSARTRSARRPYRHGAHLAVPGCD